MNRIIHVLLAAALLLSPAIAVGESVGAIDIAPHESGVQRTRYIGKDSTLYNYRWDLKRDGNGYVFFAKGDNNKSGAKRIEWTEKAVMEMSSRGLRTVSWVKESSGAEQQTWRLEYDWKANKAAYSWNDRATGKHEEKTVEFGPTAFAGDCMYFLLRGFPFQKGPGTKISGDFVMTDGQVFSGSIIHRGEERIETAFGSLDTYKLEFKIGGAIGGLAPKMFIWYTKSAPHVFVRYEGKDDGLTRPRTVNELLEFSPSDTVTGSR